MHIKVSPAKRHYSQISMPATKSSIPTSTTNSNNNNSTKNKTNHPFESFIHMFGSTFHRPSSRQQQYREQSMQQRSGGGMGHSSRVVGSSVEEEETMMMMQQHANKYPKQSSTEYDMMLTSSSSRGSSVNSYIAPSLHHGSNASRGVVTNKVSPANSASSSSIRTTTSTKQTSSSSKPTSSTDASSAWRTAICPRSQKPYYWNIHTRESRWKKPLELASTEEREAIREKERKQKEFFESMERNILKRLEDGRKEQQQKANKDANKVEGCEGLKDGRKSGAVDPLVGLGSPMSIATSVATTNISPGNDSNAGGIDQSWMQVSSSASPTEISTASEDWIAGWITPGSETSSPSSGLSALGIDRSAGLSPNNSISSFQDASVHSGTSSLSREERDDKVYPLLGKSKLERIKSASKRPVIDKPDLIRTISKMEYDLLVHHTLNPSLRIQAVGAGGGMGMSSPKTISPNSAKRDEPLTPTTATCDILSCLHLTPEAEDLAVSLAASMENEGLSPLTPATPNEEEEVASLPIRSLSSSSSASAVTTDGATSQQRTGGGGGVAKPNLTKRNTCGTIYLGSTLSAPDKDALIKCVCGVYRAHLLQAERSGNPSAAYNTNNIAPYLGSSTPKDEHLIFHDRRAPGDYRRLDTTSIPSLAQITDFYRSIFLRSQMEVDCIIISLIYIERLIKMTSGKLTPSPKNWRSILFSCMVLASKVWDDLSMWNCDFSKIGPSGVTFSLSRTNELEIALLRALEYKVKVNASEYAKYYFLLRGMLCRSGLANDEISRLSPLDAKGAVAITGGDASTGSGASAGSSGGEASKVANHMAKASMKERSKSHGCVDDSKAVGEVSSFRSGSSSDGSGVSRTMPPQSSPTSKRVSLEQIVRM